MDLRLLAWTCFYWNSPEHAQRFEGEGCWHSLRHWRDCTDYLFSPVGKFISSGTWSDPAHCPLPGIEVVNAGCLNTGPSTQRRNYGNACFAAAFYHALNRNDWDLLIFLDTDALVGAIDMDSLLREFWSRPELLLSHSWWNNPGGMPFFAMKRAGVSRAVHHYHGPHILDDDETDHPDPLLLEQEWRHTFRPNLDGPRWWNPWPNCQVLDGTDPRFGPFEQEPPWPMIGKVQPRDVERFIREQCPLAKPFKHEP